MSLDGRDLPLILSLGQLASLTSVQQVVQLLNLTSNNYSLLGGIEEVSNISQSKKIHWLISDQDSKGELVRAKALWLAVITKVAVIVITLSHSQRYRHC